MAEEELQIEEGGKKKGKMMLIIIVAVVHVPGSGRDRLVQIKVQLLVRGSDNEELAKTHIPLIEGTLLQVFSSANADDLVTEAGKIELREQAVNEVQKVLKDIAGHDVVERVLFTGFVMQ